MTEILTSKMKNDTTRMFYNDIQANDYYVYVASVTTGLVRQTAVNAQYSTNEFLENTLFGKKILGTDTKFMIKFYDWQKDAVYDQYDDTLDMEGKKFYAVVSPNSNDTGDYRVFKCLSNSNLSPSTAPPNWNPENTSQVYRTADGYVWKYLYVITSAEFEAYNAIGYIPLISEDFVINPNPNADANNIVYGSEISDIFVSNPVDNAGYKSQAGFLTAAPGNDGTLTLRADGINQITNYYNGMSIYLTNSDGRSFLYVINSYVFEPGTGYGKAKVIGDPLGDQVSNIATFTINPTCVIEGDGTGAIAIPNVIEGNIKSLLVLNAGSGYTNVIAKIVDPLFDFDPEDPNSIDVRAALRPVLSSLHPFQWNRPSVNPRAEDSVTGKHGARIGGIGERITAHFTRVIFQMQSFFSKIMMRTPAQLFSNFVSLLMAMVERYQQGCASLHALTIAAKRHSMKYWQPAIKDLFIQARS